MNTTGLRGPELIYRSVPYVLGARANRHSLKAIAHLVREAERQCVAQGLASREWVWLVSGQAECPTPFFTHITFSDDHRLRGCRNVITGLDAHDELGDCTAERWRRAADSVLCLALERFGRELKLRGRHAIRIQVKSLMHHQVEPQQAQEHVALPLDWHYDYWAHTTFTLPLLNTFPATTSAREALLIGVNNLGGDPLHGGQGPNHRHVQPVSGTIVRLHYPRRGGLLFAGQQGKQIHCPVQQVLPADSTGAFSRTLIQIVLRDEVWCGRRD